MRSSIATPGSESVLCLETSFLVNYLRGEEFASDFLEGPAADEELHVATISLWELYVGALLSNASDTSIEQTAEALDWAEPLQFTETAAREAADIRVNLRNRGEKIQVPDMLIAGTARAMDAELVATDSHFDRIEGLTHRDPRD